MLTVGNLLKKAREHSGKHSEEIAQIIKIKPEYLNKIEQNDFSSFNSSTFV
jgi:cytoskeletal protein RodZ